MKTIEQATREWIAEWNSIPDALIEASWQLNPDAWRELTPPTRGDCVYIYSAEDSGTVKRVTRADKDNGNDVFAVELDSGETVVVGEDDLEVERDGFFPMAGLFSFDVKWDDDWAREHLQEMADCGLRIYEHAECDEVFFGVDGIGYSFFTAHWIPLYKARGLQWHDEAAS